MTRNASWGRFGGGRRRAETAGHRKHWRKPLVASSQKILDSVIGTDEIHLFTCPGGEHRNFLDCVRSRELTVANPEVMHHSMTTVHAANICMWLRRDIEFDPVKVEFVDDDEANRLRSRAMRDPWII